MGAKWTSTKLHDDTLGLVPTAKQVYRKHHKLDDDEKISQDKIIRRALRYYIEN